MADYYQILNISPQATAEEIKTAYRRAAKHAHPDAGGSPAAMEAVNEAYRVLSDALLRRDYDQQQQTPPPTGQPAPHAASRQSTASAEPASEPAMNPAQAAAEHQRRRLIAARASAWRILKGSATMAALLGVLAVVIVPQLPSFGTKLLVALLSAVPIYSTFIGLVFFIEPKLRLDFHDLIDDLLHRRNPREYLSVTELNTLLAFALAYIPLALVWTFMLTQVIHF